VDIIMMAYKITHHHYRYVHPSMIIVEEGGGKRVLFNKTSR